jgi:hypothetical protein
MLLYSFVKLKGNERKRGVKKCKRQKQRKRRVKTER